MSFKRYGIALGLMSAGMAIGLAVGQGRFMASGRRDAEGRLLGHYDNTSRARGLRPGTALSRVVAELGDPVGAKDGWLEFVASPDGRTIRVKLGASGLVEAIDAGAE